MNKIFRTLCALAALLLFPAHAQAEKLTLTGSSTLAPLVRELAKRFAAQNPGVEFVVEGGGSSRGAADALAGKADIGMVSRPLHADEKSLFAFTIARDGIALVVHRDNPVKTLPLEGVPATSAAVRNGSYPLSRPLNLVTRGVPKGTARAFVEFVQSPRAREVIAEYDFVPYGH